jgi:phosphatidylglycerophosphate synthase
MNFLLPHRFKKYGVLMIPLGFTLWVSMQLRVITKLLLLFLNENSPIIHPVNVFITIISFFAFLAGIYFLGFSKEKMEDEMIQKTRLDSLQFAAFVQMVVIIVGFLVMLLYNEPDKEGMLLFFVFLLFTFWLCFISRFNYIIHISIKQQNEKYFEE